MRISPLAKVIWIVVWIAFVSVAFSQDLKWASDGNAFYTIEDNEILRINLPATTPTVLVGKKDLGQKGGKSIVIRDFALSGDETKVLIYTNTRKVWRLDTEGDYWIMNLDSKEMQQVGASRPPSSLRFAKLSPDGNKVAYVSEYNLYVQDLATGNETALTTNGTRRLINGTFDWVYEEEFACRDGFQWAPDGKRIAFWQVNAEGTRDFYMINNTDSVYSRIVPVEYPKVGESPSAVKIGVVELAGNTTTWLNISGEPRENYLPRMEWNTSTDIFVQQLNRKQNESKIWQCNVVSNEVREIFKERDDAWIDVYSPWEDVYNITYRHKFHWINNNHEFIWLSEKDGWRHAYRIAKDGKVTVITKGNYDVMNVLCVDQKNNLLYFHASPDNATQKYLYKTKLDGTGVAERITPAELEGTNHYSISPNGLFALHSFENTSTRPMMELISLQSNKPLNERTGILRQLGGKREKGNVSFFKIKIADGTELDGWMVKPSKFDPAKKYPVVFYVYTEPAGAEVKDTYGTGNNRLYKGSMADDGYIYICVDNRGTPAPKGRAWRKSIYRKIGRLNISDQAMAAKEIMKWPYVDKDRIAVWGWSGGGTATLNLMFQYPGIYKTGIAIAAVGNQLTYDNIYQERYMGLPQENMDDFIKGSPITYAKNLEGNLLYIHGTGDDNVHYANAEMLVNELIKHNKQFRLMSYPNRTHGISEGEGTTLHLSTLYTTFLKEHCSPGAK
jgi:dipeptidyl-peptidase-4